MIDKNRVILSTILDKNGRKLSTVFDKTACRYVISRKRKTIPECGRRVFSPGIHGRFRRISSVLQSAPQ